MKANELMIGDWYAFRGHPYQCTASDIASIAECEEKGAPTDISEIPLTPEILEKNGWKNSAPDVWQKKYRGFVFYWEKGTGWFGMDDFRYRQEQCKVHLRIKHIHQLQHALRLCGIDKTIEL